MLNVWNRIEQTDLAGTGSSSIRCPNAFISVPMGKLPASAKAGGKGAKDVGNGLDSCLMAHAGAGPPSDLNSPNMREFVENFETWTPSIRTSTWGMAMIKCHAAITPVIGGSDQVSGTWPSNHFLYLNNRSV